MHYSPFIIMNTCYYKHFIIQNKTILEEMEKCKEANLPIKANNVFASKVLTSSNKGNILKNMVLSKATMYMHVCRALLKHKQQQWHQVILLCC